MTMLKRAARAIGIGTLLVVLTAGAVTSGGGAAGAKPTSTASAAAKPAIVRASALRYANKTVVVVVRMSAPITANGSAFFADPSLREGETPGANQGVSPAERIGQRARHCYFVEARRLMPVKTPKGGSETKLGFAAKAEGKSGELTQVISARFAHHYVDQWQEAAARQLGCGG